MDFLYVYQSFSLMKLLLVSKKLWCKDNFNTADTVLLYGIKADIHIQQAPKVLNLSCTMSKVLDDKYSSQHYTAHLGFLQNEI